MRIQYFVCMLTYLTVSNPKILEHNQRVTEGWGYLEVVLVETVYSENKKNSSV